MLEVRSNVPGPQYLQLTTVILASGHEKGRTCVTGISILAAHLRP